MRKKTQYIVVNEIYKTIYCGYPQKRAWNVFETEKKRRAEKNLVDTRIMRSFGETPGKREALLNKLVKISETPVKREETPEKGEEPSLSIFNSFCSSFF